tara:strand:+ start:3462 stop:4220 length:759 start_codon:yes stop_codon:yes gene_type:complete
MISYYAIFTIVKYRIREFFFEYHYSILAPLISNLLFVVVFSTIDRLYLLSTENISYIDFLIPGLIIMIVAQESFDNPSVSIINSKQIGSFNDFLLAPISRIEIFISYTLSQIFIGLIIGIINFILLSYFFSYSIFSIISFIYYLSLVIIFFSSIGLVVGFLSYRWDTQSTVSNFFISPLIFLSGTFFSINSLPENFRIILFYNPFYYIVSHFRESFFQTEINFYNNFMVFTFVFIIFIISAHIFYRGYNVIK